MVTNRLLRPRSKPQSYPGLDCGEGRPADGKGVEGGVVGYSRGAELCVPPGDKEQGGPAREQGGPAREQGGPVRGRGRGKTDRGHVVYRYSIVSITFIYYQAYVQ